MALSCSLVVPEHLMASPDVTFLSGGIGIQGGALKVSGHVGGLYGFIFCWAILFNFELHLLNGWNWIIGLCKTRFRLLHW
jgi:hypothetical protein